MCATGNEGHLSQILFRDMGPEPEDDALDALIDGVEQSALAVGELLAGGRMRTDHDALDSGEEEQLIGLIGEQIRSLGDLLSKRIPDDIVKISIPAKSDLIEIGIMHLILARLESGNDRITRLDLLSIILPESLRHLQVMFSEAHFNYLLGNLGAVAIMCRALIEAALRDRVSGNFVTLHDRITEAQNRNILDHERTQCARDIATLGNQAAHGDSKFLKCTDQRIEETLINTRKILEDFYGEANGLSGPA